MQVTGVRAAQEQDDGLVALPKQFYLGFASSLGITKDISQTQAYSVWLQGKPSLAGIYARLGGYSLGHQSMQLLYRSDQTVLQALVRLERCSQITCMALQVAWCS